jgi:hypothetical protein
LIFKIDEVFIKRLLVYARQFFVPEENSKIGDAFPLSHTEFFLRQVVKRFMSYEIP